MMPAVMKVRFGFRKYMLSESRNKLVPIGLMNLMTNCKGLSEGSLKLKKYAINVFAQMSASNIKMNRRRLLILRADDLAKVRPPSLDIVYLLILLP